MEIKISPNNLAENRSELRNISEEDIVPLVEKEVVEWHLDNVEPYYFFKGAILSFIFCLPFWIILFRLINWLLMHIHFLNLDEVKTRDIFPWSNYRPFDKYQIETVLKISSP